MRAPINFEGSVPANYEEYLTPFLFDPFADDLVKRVDPSGLENILELACGTGSLTRRLIKQLPPGVRLTATDLQPDMLRVAKDISGDCRFL